MFVNRRLAGALLALLILSTGGTALAAPITGTLDLSVLDPAMNGADLASSTEVSGTDMFTVPIPPPTGNFTAVPVGTSFGPFMLDKTNLVGEFTFTNATYGTFAPGSALILTNLPDLLVVQLLGIFTPGSGLPGFDPTSARIDVRVERVGGEGGALDGTLRLTALGPAVPEPAVWTMLVIGGLALARRRRGNAR